MLCSHSQSLAAQARSALGTRAGVVRAAGGAVSAGGHAGDGHGCGRRWKQRGGLRASATEWKCKGRSAGNADSPVWQRPPLNPSAQRHELKPTHTPPFWHGFWHCTGSGGDTQVAETLSNRSSLLPLRRVDSIWPPIPSGAKFKTWTRSQANIDIYWKHFPRNETMNLFKMELNMLPFNHRMEWEKLNAIQKTTRFCTHANSNLKAQKNKYIFKIKFKSFLSANSFKFHQQHLWQ